MRRFVALAALAVALVCALVPSVSFTEDRDTVQLAKVIYALARDESYATKLAIGTVVMNRVESDWFDDTLGEVLDEQQQFPAGSRYDGESLSAAHDVLSGARTLDAGALYYQALDASQPVGRGGARGDRWRLRLLFHGWESVKEPAANRCVRGGFLYASLDA